MSGGAFGDELITGDRALAVLLTVCVAAAMFAIMPGTVVASPRLSSELSESLLELINKERSQADLPALALREDLTRVAEAHAADMIEAGYFGHMSPTTGTLAARLKAAGIRFSKAAENLAGCTSPELAHKLLMESASHKANVLSKRFTHTGVAVVKGGPYGMMIVEIFICEPEDIPVEKALEDGSPPVEEFGSLSPALSDNEAVDSALDPEPAWPHGPQAPSPLDVVGDDVPDVGGLEPTPPSGNSG